MGRDPCWIHIGWQDAGGNCTILTWWFGPESATALVAAITESNGPPHMEEALTAEDLRALEQGRLEHMGVTYLKDDPGG